MSLHQALSDFFSSRPEVLEWGVVRLDRPLPNAERLAAWVGQGLHAGLRYMEERLEERQSPRALFPWARSAVLFSLRQPVALGADTGVFRVAAYALGEDYHRRARRVLAAARERLASASASEAFRYEGFCDTWPVFERDLAAEAGLGWRGKNTCLIHRKHGSGFLLSGFFTDLDLDPVAAPETDFCGGCTACLDQCPTGALEPGRLDANKCISYWTIEAKGGIPAAISEKSGAWIFGCDICQEVCPWNHKHRKNPGEPPHDWPRSAREWLVLLRQGGGFQSRFKNSPLTRAGRKGLLRNVLLALKRLPGEPVSDLLAELDKEESDGVIRSAMGGSIHPDP